MFIEKATLEDNNGNYELALQYYNKAFEAFLQAIQGNKTTT